MSQENEFSKHVRILNHNISMGQKDLPNLFCKRNGLLFFPKINHHTQKISTNNPVSDIFMVADRHTGIYDSTFKQFNKKIKSNPNNFYKHQTNKKNFFQIV